MSTITIEVPESVRQQVEKLSADEGCSVDQFFATATSEKFSVLRELDYIRKRASLANDQEFEEVLKHIPSIPTTEEWDRMLAPANEEEADAGKRDKLGGCP